MTVSDEDIARAVGFTPARTLDTHPVMVTSWIDPDGIEVSEHPWWPKDPEACAKWLLPWLQQLAQDGKADVDYYEKPKGYSWDFTLDGTGWSAWDSNGRGGFTGTFAQAVAALAQAVLEAEA